ncbi:RHS repeat domain-containing protein [Endozoicomonas acroporae]|uniref:RHS repeat domain-containing protein n=1 Tax=Endozoicomonas acroporae TaxID=1701104 RepID=UPI003D794723
MDGLGYQLAYSTDKTITVTSDHGKVISFTQDQDFQPLNLSTDEGSVTYHYDNQRRLLKVSSLWSGFSSEKQYLYENAQFPRFLTGIIDEEGDRYASWTYDAKGRATSSFHGDGAEKVTVAYNDNGTTTVTNSLGKQTTYHYQVVQGIRKVTRIDGQPSPNCPASNASYTYNDQGLLSSKTDENQNLTTWQYNDRGLVTTTTEAKGTSEERVTLTEWHPAKRLPARIIEPTRITEFTYNDQGRLLGQQVQSR